jgi:hypothetical protein
MTSPTAGAKHVFISYVKEDSVEVDQLCRILDAAQIPYWRDRTALGPGEAWKDKIRGAIRDGALVFLACFSERSRAKPRSYMNEELTLAVEEFRMRPPGRTWIVPLRFDDGELPEWDLGAGRMLSDLNYVDMFGDRLTEEAAKLVTTIGRQLGEATPSAATTLAAVEGLVDDARRGELRRLTKEMIPDPARRIDLDSMVFQETRRVLSVLQDEAHTPTQMHSPGGEAGVVELVDGANRLWRLVEPFCWSLQVAARWADPGALRPWTSGMQVLAEDDAVVRGGSVPLINLRRLPLLCAVFTGAMAAVGQGRWDNLRALVWDTAVPSAVDGGQQRLIDASHPYRPFDGTSNLVTNALARSAVVGESVQEAIAYFQNGRGNYHTPVADWLHHVLAPVMEEQAFGAAAYDRAFDRTEIVLGVLSQDSAFERFGADQSRSWLLHSRWFGRSTWRAAHSTVSPVQELSTELRTAGASWAPLQAGFFGGDTKRAERAVDAYSEQFEQLASQRW